MTLGQVADRVFLLGIVSAVAGLVLHVRGEAEDRPLIDWSSVPATASIGEPVRLVIPRLGLAARIVPVRSRDSVLSPPDDPRVVGWWAEGPRPGADLGAAVVTAHTVHSGGGAFDDLSSLVYGDRLVVVMRGARLRFEVRSTLDLDKAALARQSQRLFAGTGRGRLLLVTCSGWDGSGFSANTVVVARPVGQSTG